MTITDPKHRSDVYPSAAPGDDMLGGLGYGTMSVAALLAESAHRMPERTAIIWGGTATTYREFLRAGELGEIAVRGHNLFKGYLGRPEDTAAAIVDGWFRTGDLGTKDEGDINTIVDRKKDMIVRNGYNVYPSEVEGVIMRLPPVANAAVFGVPDEQHGHEIHAAVILKADQTLDEAELIAYVNEHLAAYKYPRHVHFVSELPIGASGKILKRELVAQYTSAN